MNGHQRQGKWTGLGLLGFMLAVTVGGLAFLGVASQIDPSQHIAAPWGLVAVFLLPISFALQILFKVWDLEALEQLTRRERQRLRPVIQEKKSHLYVTIMLFVLAAIASALLFTWSQIGGWVFLWAMGLTGGLLGGSLWGMAFLFKEIDEVQKFRADVEDRARSDRRRAQALKRLSRGDGADE